MDTYVVGWRCTPHSLRAETGFMFQLASFARNNRKAIRVLQIYHIKIEQVPRGKRHRARHTETQTNKYAQTHRKSWTGKNEKKEGKSQKTMKKLITECTSTRSKNAKSNERKSEKQKNSTKTLKLKAHKKAIAHLGCRTLTILWWCSFSVSSSSFTIDKRCTLSDGKPNNIILLL